MNVREVEVTCGHVHVCTDGNEYVFASNCAVLYITIACGDRATSLEIYTMCQAHVSQCIYTIILPTQHVKLCMLVGFVQASASIYC